MANARVRPSMLYAWRGTCLLIVSPEGVVDGAVPMAGFYCDETRVVSQLRLTINGEAPWLCESASVAPDTLTFEYVHPEITQPGGGGTGQSESDEHVDARGLPERALDIRLEYRVRLDAADVVATIVNRARQDVSADLRWDLGADFADIIETISGRREQQAGVDVHVDDRCVEFAYQHATLPYSVSINTSAPLVATTNALHGTIALSPNESTRLVFTIRPRTLRPPLAEAEAAQRERALHEWAATFTRIEIPGNRLAEWIVARNARDIASFPMLVGANDEWLAPQAGMPSYPAFFGRDAVTAGWQAALLDCGAMLDASLTRLGRAQAVADDPWRDAERGRIPYQMRTGPLAQLNLNPYSAYYADYASPLMYVISLANLFAWTGDASRLRAHWDTARAIMDWAREHGDLDGDGYLEYFTHSPVGTKNQGWKDSGDAIVYDDGSTVPSPIATCELQGYWYAAQQLMGLLCGFMNATTDAVAYERSATDLKARFNRDWWISDEHVFALALDPDKRQVRAASSNVGHCLAAGIVDRDHVDTVVERLFAPDMFSGWGIRTLTSRHARYDPISYHRGSVWAVEQGTVVFGLRRYGFDARAIELARAMFDLADLYPEFRIPECVGGTDRRERATPGAYPRANTPQLWNATAFPLIVQTLLGIVPLAPAGVLIVDPVLPAWMPSLVLHDLRVGNATVTLAFSRRDEGDVDWHIVRRNGALEVIEHASPQSVHAGLGTRLGDLVSSLLRKN